MISAGQSIGNYHVLAKIGTGGMGAVFLAEHPLIGKKVALKVIHRELAGNREVVQRFFQEARAVNKIGNEHIVEIHDFGVTPEGDHFYIMEYLEGQTLASVLSRDTRVAIPRALHVGAQIASALGAAHASGVIHRDLKPDNIMLMTRLGDPDFVKVLDFGLAKIFQGQSAVHTAAGVLLGTPQYMSPEACESKREIDHRTDIYALGILLFQMLTGVLPFDGESMGEVLVKQVTALPPAPRGLNPAIPPSVEQILLRCLAKPVDARFATMAALREALLDPEAYLRGSPPIAPARSVAPGEAGVDARQVMAHAAQRVAARQATGGGGLPLPAPAPTLIGDSYVASQMIGDAAAPGRKSAAMPLLTAPAETKNHTMRIATPMGYSSRPPRKVWPIVLVVGLLLGLGGGAFAVAWFGRGSGPTAAAGSAGSGSAGPGSALATVPVAVDAAVPSPDAAVASLDAAVATPDAAVATNAPVAATVKLAIDSEPPGAAVYLDGKLAGKAPLRVEVPAAKARVELELRLAGYKKKLQAVELSGNTAVRLELERAPAAHPAGKGGGKGSGKAGGDGLLRPDDL